MITRLACVLMMAALLCTPFSQAGAPEWKSLFDGKTLSGWDGDPKFWSVQEETITGITTATTPTKGNTFAIYVGDNADKAPVEFGDFELKLEFRIFNHNSGIQYRSFKLPGNNDGWRVGGYQADFDHGKAWVGTNYGERFRGVLAKRGEKVTYVGKKDRKVEKIGDAKDLAGKVKDAPQWNEYHIIAKGFQLTQKINGVTMSEFIDNDEKNRRAKGLIAIQLHGGPPMKIQIRNIQIKEIK